MLEAVHAFFFDECAHVALHGFIPPGDGNVKTVVPG